MTPCLGEKKDIAPNMNGIESNSKLKEFFPSAIAIDTVIYSATKINGEFSSTQIGKYVYIFIKSKEDDEKHQNAE